MKLTGMILLESQLKMINEFLDIPCGCRLLVQGEQVFNIGICTTHYGETSKRVFMNMARTALNRGTNIK